MTEAKLDEVINRYMNNAEYVRQRGDLAGCMEFRELAEFLTECKKSLIACGNAVSREHLLSGIDELMQSPWFNRGKDDLDSASLSHYGYVERKEAVEVVRDLCVKTEPSVTPARKLGKWNIENYEYLPLMYVCSNCGFKWKDADSYGKYCPMCGAEMEKGEHK